MVFPRAFEIPTDLGDRLTGRFDAWCAAWESTRSAPYALHISRTFMIDASQLTLLQPCSSTCFYCSAAALIFH
jgi:hypothetical protein